MTVGGWIVMLLSVGFVTGLLVWSVCRVLRIPEATRHVHSQTDIDTPDVE